ncbi:transposase zinc-binding domain-containing protein [Enterocloster clostridioformis]|uniref:transposase zinc-binding domain-containing protein n=1 Tax=Enterocloster clostridioformis TaxID=1531 RepID=UPI0022E461EA|nr:transposase zinc-binding domain-containing protein [Enterocloster clostridioformis]
MCKKNILQTIFSDHFEYVQYVIRPGNNVLDNIDRMINCHAPSFGGAFFGCPHCGNLKFVPFSCKSRFCPSCGNMYNQKRALRMSCKLVSCNHRHCVFTIPVKYISRYLGRPVIATSRIDAYDGDCVTFHYQRHEDHKTITECIPAIDFIKRLIVHIPDRHFKMVRYYGIYAKHHKQEKNLRKCLSLRSGNIFPDYWTGVIRFFWPLAMIRSDARSVALLCWF